MSTLTKASTLAKMPVVTFAGEDVAQLKDLIYSADGGQIGAFTLAGRGLFSGPSKTALPWESVVGLGPDAVIISSADVLIPIAEVLQAISATSTNEAARSDIIKSEVLTDAGESLGRVCDVIIAIADEGHGQADVVGYEVDPAESLGRGKQRLLIPLPDTLAASGEHLMVPASARNYLQDNMTGFGQAVDAFRAQLGEPAIPVDPATAPSSPSALSPAASPTPLPLTDPAPANSGAPTGWADPAAPSPPPLSAPAGPTRPAPAHLEKGGE